jgi:hypothetical protein
MTRPMKIIPMEERRQILLELEVEDSKVVRERHDINNTVLSHIRFFHGTQPRGVGDITTRIFLKALNRLTSHKYGSLRNKVRNRTPSRGT